MMKIGNKIKLDNYHHNYRLNKYNNNYEKHEFDRELRLLNLELLEKIELNFKKYLINFYEQNGGIKNKELYLLKFFDKTLNFINDKEKYLKEESRDVKNKLKNSFSFEIGIILFIDKLTFGESLKLFKNLKLINKKQISKNYGINVFIFGSWIYCLKYLRNLCSHSENIYNRKMNYQLEGKYFIDNFGLNNSYLVYFLVLSIFEINILNTNLWQNKVINLLKDFNIEISEISLRQKNSLPSKLESEAWKALVDTLYRKMIKKSNVFLEKKNKFNIILALDEKNGLGKDGDLAWRIKEDMKYFAKVSIGDKKNAVIMGRKTWDSIPEKYRPLTDRKNIILTRDKNFSVEDKNVSVFLDFNEAIKKIYQDKNIGEIFIIGGAQIYNLALKNDSLQKIYLTRVKGDFNCDVFVDLDLEKFELLENSDWKKTQKGIEFRFEVYGRKNFN